MNLKRSRLEIFLEVLKVIKDGNTKITHIMYHTNVGWNLLMGVLCSLMDQELITMEKHGKRTLYRITEKGESILKYFHEGMELIEIKWNQD